MARIVHTFKGTNKDITDILQYKKFPTFSQSIIKEISELFSVDDKLFILSKTKILMANVEKIHLSEDKESAVVYLKNISVKNKDEIK